MKINRLLTALAVPAMLLTMVAGCKTTEKNYKEAYDIALAKREKDKQMRDSMSQQGINLFEDRNAGSWRKCADGDSVLSKREFLRALDGDTAVYERFVVAVASYRMKSNASAQSSDLRKKGYDTAGVLMNSVPSYYVVAATFADEKEACDFVKQYKKDNPKVPYIGLPDNPVVIDKGHR